LATMFRHAAMTATVRAQTWPANRPKPGAESDEPDDDVYPAPRRVELEDPLLGHQIELIVDQAADP